MPTLPDKVQGQISEVKFGSGINTNQSETDIDPSECAAGSLNYDLRVKNSFMQGRLPFDDVATVPDLGEVRGFAQLKKQDGTLSTLIQCGVNVYEWDGEDGFTLVGAVAAGARMRGYVGLQNWTLDELVIITDIELRQPVMTWDGAAFIEMPHNLGGHFYAKYCFVEGESAWFGNVKSGSVATPHMLVRSKISDYTTLSVSNRPSSSLGDGDAFFLLTPDLRPINAVMAGFGVIVISTQKGRIYRTEGTTAKDMALTQLFDGSAADGPSPMALIGNDVLYGRQGAIETLFSVQNFGDVSSDDVSFPIRNLIEDVGGWTVVYNQRNKRAYMFATDIPFCFVYEKTFRDEKNQKIAARETAPTVSGWMIWETAHDMAFMPACAWSMYNPVDGLEQTYMGSTGGKIFMFEGAGGQDAGLHDISVTRISKVITAPRDAEAYNVSGFLSYRKLFDVPFTITLMFQGTKQQDQEITTTLLGAETTAVFGGPYYFGGPVYFGIPFEGRIIRQPLGIPGIASDFQVKLVADASKSFAIHKLQIEYETGG